MYRKIFCVDFQRYPLKFHIKYLTHTLREIYFIASWKFKSSYIYELILFFWNSPLRIVEAMWIQIQILYWLVEHMLPVVVGVLQGSTLKPWISAGKDTLCGFMESSMDLIKMPNISYVAVCQIRAFCQQQWSDLRDSVSFLVIQFLVISGEASHYCYPLNIWPWLSDYPGSSLLGFVRTRVLMSRSRLNNGATHVGWHFDIHRDFDTRGR